MSAVTTMIRAKKAGIHLYLKDNKLAFKATNKALDDSLKSAIIQYKSEIVSLLLSVQTKPELSVQRSNLEKIPCSFAQQRMWLIDQIEQGTYKYNIPNALRLVGELKIDKLEAALNIIIKRHEVLRTRYLIDESGEPYQNVDEYFEFALTMTDLSHSPATNHEQEIAHRITLQSMQSFRLDKDLMIRAELIKLETNVHVLILTTHHIASDGWSMGILTNELIAVYSSLIGNNVSLLPSLKIQYGDFSIWQRKVLSGDSLSQLTNYWITELAGIPLVHNLPLDRPRLKQPSYSGGRIVSDLDAQLINRLKRLAYEQDSTLFMVLHAAFAILLSLYSGEEDILIGTPVSNRELPELEQLIGCFVNTLVLRTNLEENPSCISVIQQSKLRLLSAYEHQQLPFEKLVDELQPQRSNSHSPLFQVMLVMQNYAAGKLAHNDLEILPMAQDAPAAIFDINLIFAEQASGATVSWCYAKDLFDQTTIERMAQSFVQVLWAFVDNPTQSLSDIPLLSETDKAYLLNHCNDTIQPFPDNITMIDWFEEQVIKTPDILALISGETALSYAELNNCANALANEINTTGNYQDKIIGICMYRSAEMVVAILACHKVGAAYVPLDPELPLSQIDYIVQDTGLQLILENDSCFRQIKKERQALNYLDVRAAIASKHVPAYNTLRSSTPASAAYIIYTSGSTGGPKGVVCGHSGLVNRINWMQKTYQLTTKDVVLQKTPFNFDVSVWEFYWPLVAGARLVMAKPGGHIDPTYLVETVQHYAVTVLHFVPSMLEILLQSEDWGKCTSVREVICSGEALSTSVVNLFYQSGTKAKLHNLYGPTEASIDVSFWHCLADAQLSQIPIGLPIDNTELHILNANRNLVPLGVAGELYIAGVGLAHAYLNNPELTSERFLGKLLPDSRYSRFYRTGDLARRRVDGVIEYLGRIDQQTKLRGMRIELSAIESRLITHEAVDRAVVTTDVSGQSLIAFVVLAVELIDLSVLSDLLRQTLPDYMVPSQYLVVPDIPLTYSGKVNKRALQSMIGVTDSSEQSDYDAPNTSIQRKLHAIWEKILETNVAGIDIGFFEAGGHSLKAIKLVMNINQIFQVNLSVADVFEFQSIRRLASRVEKAQLCISDQLRPIPANERAPLSYSQQRIWVVSQLDQDNSQYNMPFAFWLNGDFNERAFLEALNLLVARNEILRTIYGLTDEGEVEQLVLDEAKMSVRVMSAPKDEARLFVEDLFYKELNQPFYLDRDISIRATLVKYDVSSVFLILTLHHIAADGWSVNLLITQLTQIYNSLRSGQPIALPEETLTYKDFAYWQRRTLSEGSLQKSADFWKATLAGLPITHSLALDYTRPPTPSRHGNTIIAQLPLEVSSLVPVFCTNNNVTRFTLIQTAFSAFLYRMTAERDIVIGCPVANRDNEQTRDMVGCFINNLVVRTQIDGKVSFAELLQQCNNYLTNAYRHQALPFEVLVDKLNPKRSSSHSPLFQILLNVEVVPEDHSNFDAVEVHGREASGVIAKYDITLMVSANPDRLTFLWEYATDLFNAETIKRLSQNFNHFLEQILTGTNRAIDEIQLVPEHAAQSVTRWGNQNQPLITSYKCLHRLFEAQVEAWPDRLAIVCKGKTISYSRLNARANLIAHGLMAQGCQSGDIVGISMSRSADMVAAMIAVLKLGAAYLPLDPTYPLHRLEAMQTDSSVSIIITDSSVLNSYASSITILNTCVQDWLLGMAETNPDLTGTDNSDSIAYLIYTSGSTGLPKGVPLSHANACSMLEWSRQFYSRDELLCVLASTSINFDLSIFELFLPLTTGTTAYLVDNILSLVNDKNIYPTLINTVPSGMETLLDLNSIPSSTKVINVAGESLTTQLLNRMLALPHVNRVVNLYGPSEATTYSTYSEFTTPINTIPNIGEPLSNTCCYVLDEQRIACPVGVVGELYIGGSGLAKGYLNRPDLTKEKFIKAEGARPALYRTGDLVRWRDDGKIDFIGRNDSQVKIHGYRIELGEVEFHIASCPGVKKGIVVVNGEQNTDKHLVGYVVPDPDGTHQISDLCTQVRVYLSQYLPDYMIPQHIIGLTTLPLTPNGKVDKAALPLPDHFTFEQTQQPPVGKTEHVLAQIWASLLGIDVENIMRQSRFFDLGGHSLLLIKLHMRVNQAFKTSVKESDLYEHSSIEKMATFIESSAYEDDDSMRYNKLKTKVLAKSVKRMAF